MTDEKPVTAKDLGDLFERGDVFADRWSTSIRSHLDVADPLVAPAREALRSGLNVVIAGEAGDGKSHLALTVLADLPLNVFEVRRGEPLPKSLPAGTVVFVRDASALPNEAVIDAIELVAAEGARLLLTVNEGPLNTLSLLDTSGFLGSVRATVHARAQGLTEEDPPGVRIINLAGRQLTKNRFVEGALKKILPTVRPCRTCGPKSKDCPRVVGASILKKKSGEVAAERISLLLQMLTDRGQHLTARDIWAFLIDLFFGWVCSSRDEQDQQQGFFWNRVFDSSNPVSTSIGAIFDPLLVARAHEDSALWRGSADQNKLGFELPFTPPHIAARRDEELALDLFTSAKRLSFFLSKSWDVRNTLSEHVPANKYGEVLRRAWAGEDVAPQFVGALNRFRICEPTQNDLWISRHTGFSAHRRPAVFAASGKVPSSELTVRVPFIDDAKRFPDAGYFPSHLLLAWNGSDQVLRVDFDTWLQLQDTRSMTVDRAQESLDFAIDLFLAQASPARVVNPEIKVYDHRRARLTTLRVESSARRIEVL